MYFIYRKYGKITEITEIEKQPSQVRLPATRERRLVHGLRRQDNIRRTRKICMWRVSAALEELGSPLLVTLTFRGDASDASFANDSLRRFQVRLRGKFPDAQSLFIPELSRRGRIHFHGLIFNVPMHLGDSRVGGKRVPDGSERKDRVLAKLWGEGFVDAIQTDGSGRLVNYISKYITKGAGEVMFNAMRLLRISHGFPKEIVIRGPFAKYLAYRYSGRQPIREKEWDNQFLGKITRKIYEGPL